MEIPTLAHCILDTIIFAITFLRLTLCFRTFPSLRKYRFLDFGIFLVSFCSLFALGVLDWRWENENAQHILIGISAIFPPIAEFLRLFRLLDQVSVLLQKLCCMIAATGSLIKLLLVFLSLRTPLPLRFGIVGIVIVDYFCIAASYYWLARRSLSGHLGRAKLQEFSKLMCTVAVVLFCIAIPGASLHSWRLSLEGQLLISTMWALQHVFHSRAKWAVREEPLLILNLESRPIANQGSSSYHGAIREIDCST